MSGVGSESAASTGMREPAPPRSHISSSDDSSTISFAHSRGGPPSSSQWPVPQVIVTCMGLKSAWGRSEIVALGYDGIYKRIRETYILPQMHHYYNTLARLKGTFHYGDHGSVLLHPVGWAEMVMNLDSIEVEFGYTDGYPIWDPMRLPKA